MLRGSFLLDSVFIEWRVFVLELSIRFLVALDQSVLLMRRNGAKLLVGLVVLSYIDSPDIWRMAWMIVVTIVAATFFRVMGGYDNPGGDVNQ